MSVGCCCRDDAGSAILIGVGDERRRVRKNAMPSFELRYLGRQESGDRDVLAVRLRALRDGAYFQFFMGLIGGPDVPVGAPEPRERWWQAFAVLTARQVEVLVADGFLPSIDPMTATEVRVRFDVVAALAGSGEKLPELADGLLAGSYVLLFDT